MELERCAKCGCPDTVRTVKTKNIIRAMAVFIECKHCGNSVDSIDHTEGVAESLWNQEQKLNKKTARIDGRTVTIGDFVFFKSDIEQAGTVSDIKKQFNRVVLVLESSDGFEGEYIGGDLVTEVDAEDCW